MVRPRLAAAPLLVLVLFASIALGSCDDSVQVPANSTRPDRTAEETPEAEPTPRSPGYARIFATDSIWSTPLEPDAKLSPRSDALIETLLTSIEQHVTGGIGPSLTAQARAPVYVVGARTRLVPVQLETTYATSLRRELARGVPIPARARPSSGSDHSIVIWQPSSDTYWELYMAERIADPSVQGGIVWRATFGGIIHRASRSPGYFRDRRIGRRLIEHRYWGASATGLALAGGMVTREDLQAGRIGHALSLGLPNLDPSSSIIAAGVHALPAQRSDGKSLLPDAIPEGARLRLDPAVNIDELDLSPFVRMLAEAAQRYGMFVHDGSASTVVYGEDPTPYIRAGQPNFYDIHIGDHAPGFLSEFPWEHLRILSMTLRQDPPD